MPRARIFYREETDYVRDVRSYLHDFAEQTGKEIEVAEVDGREGQDLVRLYDLHTLPAILVTAEDGRLLYRHRGMPLPLMREIAAWL